MKDNPVEAYRHSLMDPQTSEWLKRAIGENLSRDPVDAYNDAEALFEIMRNRYQVVIARAFER